jgi:hypothetical protein
MFVPGFDYSNYYAKKTYPIANTIYQDDIYNYIDSVWFHESLIDTNNNNNIKDDSKIVYSKTMGCYIYKKDGEYVNITNDIIVTNQYFKDFKYEKIGKYFLPTLNTDKEILLSVINALEQNNIDYSIKNLLGNKIYLQTDIGDITNTNNNYNYYETLLKNNKFSFNNDVYTPEKLVDIINTKNEIILNFKQYNNMYLK